MHSRGDYARQRTAESVLPKCALSASTSVRWHTDGAAMHSLARPEPHAGMKHGTGTEDAGNMPDDCEALRSS